MACVLAAYIVTTYDEAWWSPFVDSQVNITIASETEEDMVLYLV